MRVLDSEGNELKKVICQDCKGLGYQERTKRKSPGVTHRLFCVFKVSWLWVGVGESAEKLEVCKGKSVQFPLPTSNKKG